MRGRGSRKLNGQCAHRVRPRNMGRMALWWSMLAAIALALSASSSSFADTEILVIVSKDHPANHLGLADLRPLFKVTKTNWASGDKANPINLPISNVHRRDFDEVVLGMSPDDVSKYWIDRKIRGNGRPPRSVPSPPAVVAVVAADRGAVGYVPAGTSADRVKVVARIRDGKLLAP